MNTKLAALASAILATASLASAAQAGGGGVRLGFGGPLGTFVATPAHGGGGGYHNKPSKRLPVVQAARKQELQAARKQDVQAARKQDKPTRIVKAQQPDKVEQETAAPSNEIAPAATGSSALIQGSIPADNTAEQPDATTSDSPAPDTRAEAPASTVTASTDKAPDETGCKKFMPAIGTTVSVGCGN